MKTNGTDDNAAYENFQKFLRSYNMSTGGTPSPEETSGDSVPIVIILGAFFSICAVISLIVLLFVYCTQHRGQWPFRRRGDEKADVVEVNAEQQALWNQSGGAAETTDQVTIVDERPVSPDAKLTPTPDAAAAAEETKVEETAP